MAIEGIGILCEYLFGQRAGFFQKLRGLLRVLGGGNQVYVRQLDRGVQLFSGTAMSTAGGAFGPLSESSQLQVGQARR